MCRSPIGPRLPLGVTGVAPLQQLAERAEVVAVGGAAVDADRQLVDARVGERVGVVDDRLAAADHAFDLVRVAADRLAVLGEDRGSFPLKGSNWFVRPDLAVHPDDWEKAWKADLKLLDQTHATLRDAVADLSPDELPVVPPGSKTTTGDLIYSIAMHDIYHAGQVQLIKRLKANGRRQPAGG